MLTILKQKKDQIISSVNGGINLGLKKDQIFYSRIPMKIIGDNFN